MNSLTATITHHDICAQIRMERQKHSGTFLLLEGAHDSRRFKKFVDMEQCSIVVCSGRSNVIAAIGKLQDQGFTDSLGLADADFDRLLKQLPENEDIIYSRYHDFDVDVISSSAFERYLEEVGNSEKILSAGTISKIRNDVLQFIRPISAMRLVNQVYSMGYRLGQFDLRLFLAETEIDIDKMIAEVSQGKFSSNKDKELLRKRIDDCLLRKFDLWQFSNGHDLMSAVSIRLEDQIGSRKGSQNYPSEV
ncbi:DUF4435 domain-containing protein [Parasedimentitalea psychrophila]|uniref:DUF4435 domain-containing protein n=1 Tax=Parasedimentitalea psychrophila TaxID=2997337 RepID=A0A9Y2L3L1_9RHOB|nr:DUF4435 domain-containing protein [Parasedimentitalea psychrophila]WIY27369.1 DUF4435 domain-containing protein [Parasedimentitalea psychrophila]